MGNKGCYVIKPGTRCVSRNCRIGKEIDYRLQVQFKRMSFGKEFLGLTTKDILLLGNRLLFTSIGPKVLGFN